MIFRCVPFFWDAKCKFSNGLNAAKFMDAHISHNYTRMQWLRLSCAYYPIYTGVHKGVQHRNLRANKWKKTANTYNNNKNRQMLLLQYKFAASISVSKFIAR